MDFVGNGTEVRVAQNYGPYYGDPQNGAPNFGKPSTLNPKP